MNHCRPETVADPSRCPEQWQATVSNTLQALDLAGTALHLAQRKHTLHDGLWRRVRALWAGASDSASPANCPSR